MSTEAPLPQVDATPGPGSLPARLANVFASPGEVFAEVSTAPVCHANWLLPAVIFVVASWCAAAVLFSNPNIKQQMADIQEQAIQKRLQPQIDAGTMTQAQVDQVKAQTERFAGIGQMIGGFVSPVVAAFATPFWGGFLLWLGGIWIFRQPFGYMKAVEAVGLTLVVLAVGALVRGLLCAAMGSLFASPGPVLLVKNYDPANLLHSVLLVLDVFTLWGLVLRAVGLARLSRVSFAKAAAWVLGTWVLLTGGLLVLSWGAQRLASSLTGQN